MSLVLVAHLASTWFMTGLIWFVQVVHYPLFARVGADGFVGYEAAHQRLTSWIVSIVMPVELVTGVLLLRTDLPAWLTWSGLALLAAIWLSTALLQMPRHQRLASAYEAGTQRSLVRTNWVRTAAWTARALLLGYALTRGYAA